MIPKTYRADDLRGELAIVDTPILRNKKGQTFAQGTVVRIVDCERGPGGMEIATAPCPQCGVSATMSGVKRGELTLVRDAGVRGTTDFLTAVKYFRILRESLDKGEFVTLEDLEAMVLKADACTQHVKIQLSKLKAKAA